MNPAKREIERNPDRITKILGKQAERLNFDGIEFPVNLKDIEKFERLSPEFKVNVFGYEAGCGVFPLRTSKFKGEKKLIRLLENKHYCLVKNFSRLVSMQISKHHGVMEICDWCLNHFPNEKTLEKHQEYC